MSAADAARLLGDLVFGYLLGAIPTGVIVGRLWKGVDVRLQGSGHTGGLNTVRVVGWLPGVIVGLADVAKGAGAILIARAWGPQPWSVTVAGVGVVLGHIWSAFIGLRGGVGISVLVGAYLVLHPMLVPLVIVVYGILYLIWWNRPRATAAMFLSPGPLLLALGASTPLIVLGVLGGGVASLKLLLEIRRGYKAIPFYNDKVMEE